MFASFSSKAAAGAVIAATAGLMLAPATASAQTYTYQGDRYGSYNSYGQQYGQPYGYNDGYGQPDRYSSRYDSADYCRSDRNQRRAAGATIGAGVGAVAGSQLAARGRRTEGSILGGVLGAFVGGAVGNDSSRDCDRYDNGAYSYGNDGYGRYDSRYDSRYEDQRYDDRYDDRYRYEDRSGYRSDRYGCRTVSTQSRDWNGRLVTRYEEVCDSGY
jgi:uncharacterized protein YcfJ